MQLISKLARKIIILCLAIQVPVFAFDGDAPATMKEVEEFYQHQQQIQNKQNNIRAIRLREWQEAQRKAKQPISQEQSYNQLRNENPVPEAEDLFTAAVNGNNAQIGKLLAQGLDINTPNNERETALHMAAARGHYSTVIYLVNNGAYTKAKTVKNWIPLHHAVRFRHANIVNYLVQRGSSPEARTSDGLSSIDMARNMNDYRLLSILGAR